MATTNDESCRTGEYEEITRGHPWERSRGSREVLQCPNCLLDLELMRSPGCSGLGAVAARFMPSAATRIGEGLEPSPCPGTPVPDDHDGMSYYPAGTGRPQDGPGAARGLLPGPDGQRDFALVQTPKAPGWAEFQRIPGGTG